MKLDIVSFIKFRDLIEEKTGLYLSYNKKKNVEKELLKIYKEHSFNNTDEFYNYLKINSKNNIAFKKLVNSLTTKETYFFRNNSHFEILENSVLPEIIERCKAEKKIRILSTGCSTGEEAYSIAIVLHRLLRNINGWNIKILAVDINNEYLETAKTGLYGSWSFREKFDEEILKDYFTEKNGKFEIISIIKEMAHFADHNLVEEYSNSLSVPEESIDIIFCRNVMIYFKKSRFKKVVNMFYDLLKKNGYLFVSNSDLIFPIFKMFQIRHFQKAIIFQKSESINDSMAEKFDGLIQHKEEKQSKLEQKETLENKIVETLENSYKKLEIDPDSVEDYVIIAKILLDKGDFENAYEWCTKAIQKDKLNVDAYFILSMIFEEQQNYDKAVETLKKVIYLDNSFVLGYYSLGNLYQRLDDIEQAEKYYRSAVRILEPMNKNVVIPFLDDLTVGELLGLIKIIIDKKVSKTKKLYNLSI
ncbi:CheR family methyltransferase [candidate division KSB1 bacterium]